MCWSRQSGCPCWLFLNAQFCQVKSSKLHVLIKIVRNPSRSHPVSLCQIPRKQGNLSPLTAFFPVLGFVFPPAVFHLPFCSSCVAIYRFFLLLYALSRWVSCSSHPPTTPLISWAGSTVSLCSKESWRAALWTGCWHRNTEPSPLPRWSWFPGCRASFGATEPKTAVEILLYLPQCLDSLSKPKIQMLLLASCNTSKH